MNNIRIQAGDLKIAAEFYVTELGFMITKTADFIRLYGANINLFIERRIP